MVYLRSFVAGFLATLIFHQGLIALLFSLRIIPRAPYDMSPTAPIGLPSVISLAFFGGLWGILIWNLIKKFPRKAQLARSLIYGAVGPTLVAVGIVLPLKGVTPRFDFFLMGLVLNAFWGLGLWLFMFSKTKS